jgi:DNA-binding MarR family transcriptional regulator
VQRLRDTADERRVLLQLTPAGRRLKARAVAVPQAIACATACDLSEVSALAAQLQQLRDRLIESSTRAA